MGEKIMLLDGGKLVAHINKILASNQHAHLMLVAALTKTTNEEQVANLHKRLDELTFESQVYEELREHLKDFEVK